MTSPAASWQLERLSANARETAEAASVGAGLSLSAWLTRVIVETCAAEGVTPQSAAPIEVEHAEPSAVEKVEPNGVERVEPTPQSNADESLPLPLQEAKAAVEALALRQPAPADVTMLPVDAMAPAKLGTRLGDDAPEALLADIAERGVRQPLLVRRSAGAPERFDIICGHRRWRGAQRAGLARVPATICTHDDGQAILASLAENMKLGDLSPLEEAHAYLQLLTRCAVETAAITAASGRDRPHIIRAMRLLGLPPSVRQLISGGLLSAEHTYLLLDAPNPQALAEAIVAEHLSVEAARQRFGASSREVRS